MTYRIRHLTCGVCAYRQRLKIRLAGDTEVMPACIACGASAWLALPALRAPEPVCPALPYMPTTAEFWAFLRGNLNPGAFE